MKRWKIHSLIFLGAAGALLLSAALVNWFVDSSRAFGRGAELERAAAIVLSGGIFEGPANFDHGAYITCLVNGANPLPDAISLGSSRAFLVRSGHLGGNVKFLNNAVADAGVKDMMGVVGLYLSRGGLPGRIIIVTDPWTLTSVEGAWASLSRSAEITQAVMENRPPPDRFGDFNPARYSLLLNYDYTRRNLKSVFNPPSPFRFLSAPEGNDFGRFPDNSMYYPLRNERMGDAEIANDARAWAPLAVFTRGTVDRLPARRLFEKFVLFLKNRGSDVTLLLVPFNPATWEMAAASPRHRETLPAAEEYYRAFAAKNGIRSAGSYNPAVYGLKAADFYDGIHPKERVYGMILQDAVLDLPPVPGTEGGPVSR